MSYAALAAIEPLASFLLPACLDLAIAIGQNKLAVFIYTDARNSTG